MATQKEVGEHLDLSDRWIRNLVKDGVLPSAKGKGGHDLDDCRKSYIDYLRAMAKQASGPEVDPEEIDLDRERARLVKAQADMQEMRNEVMEGRYIPTDFGRDVLAKVLNQVTGILNALPLTIKRKHPQLEQRIIDSVSSEIVKHSNEAAKLDEFIDQAINDVINESEGKV